MLNRFVPAFAWVVALSFISRNVSTANASNISTTWSTGSVQLDFWLKLPPIPTPIDQWAALIPLAVYLSNARSDFDLAGEVTLTGRLSVSVIPKLWALGGIVKMLKQADVFFDSASATGDLLKVYDVQWGSVFPCYNSAAALAVAEEVFSHGRTDPNISRGDLNRWILENQDELLRRFTLDDVVKSKNGVTSEVYCGSDLHGLVERKRLFGRRQLLKVITVNSVGTQPNQKQMLRKLLKSKYWHAMELVFVLALAGFLLSLGFLGSGALLVIGALSRFCSQNVRFDHSDLYLRNREVHEGCMLVSLHENTTSWTLYLGHRGLIDSLLNKPMVEPGRAHPLILLYLQFAEVLQVLGMTYIAGEGGWDGIVLVLLIFTVWILASVSGKDKHASRWLEEEGFAVSGFSCEFPDRSELLGAVQLLSTEKKTYWMDGIIAPVPRRDVWLKKIGAIDSDSAELEKDCAALCDHDKLWVTATGMQAIAGHRLIQDMLKSLSRD
jgi:hypothetical protein